MRTPVSIQGLFIDSSESPAQGQITARPSQAVSAGARLYSADPARGIINVSGQLCDQGLQAFNLWATDDSVSPSEPPLDYTFSLRISGQALQEFRAYVPGSSTAPETNGSTTSGSAIIHLSDLLASSSMVGGSISGANIPNGATVTDYDDIANTLTLSLPATATGSGLAFVVPGAILLASLMEDAV